MPEPVYLVYLDAYHLADPLFAESLARLLAHRASPLPCLLLHGSGEAAVRRLEAEGLFPELEHGRVVPRTTAEAALVEQAIRQATRTLVATLTDAGVPAVGFQGADRGLLRATEAGVEAGRLSWLIELVRQGVVPVVSALARADGAARREASLADATRALAGGLPPAESAVAVFFTRTGRAGLPEGETVAETADFETLPAAILPDPEAVRAVVGSGVRGLLTSPAGLLGGANPRGTRLFPPKSA